MSSEKIPRNVGQRVIENWEGARAPQQDKVSILLVDGCQGNLTALEAVLKSPEYELVTASSGQEALRHLLDRDFALILLDVQMPDMDGFETATRIRTRERSRQTPIVFVTAVSNEERFVCRGYESGAVDYILKPFEPSILRSKVGVFADLHRMNRLLKAQAEAMREELERAKEYAETANNAKSRFLANVSHEIRTPLGVILGFAELMTDSQRSQQDRDNCVETIRRNGQQLLRIIDEVLDLSKIEAGRLEIEKIAVDLRGLVDDVRNLFEVQTQSKGLGLSLSWDDSVPPAVVTDPTRLRQILTNVIGNSVKFTADGSVEVSVTAVPLDAREGGSSSPRMRVRFVVKDTGCGLGEEQKRRLFQPFGQADMTITRKFGGTGLGLSLSRQLARSLEGNVELVESAPGQGSVFAIEIVADVAAKLKVMAPRTVHRPVENAKKGERLKGLKILIAEDGADNRILITRMLQMNGAEVASVDNGHDVIGKALDGDYDLILMDIQMPIMNGYDATKSLRKAAYRKPIIALTAYAMKEERERCLSMGCDDYLTKPIDYPEFLEKITTACFGEKELTVDCGAS